MHVLFISTQPDETVTNDKVAVDLKCHGNIGGFGSINAPTSNVNGNGVGVFRGIADGDPCSQHNAERLVTNTFQGSIVGFSLAYGGQGTDFWSLLARVTSSWVAHVTGAIQCFSSYFHIWLCMMIAN